MVKKCNSQDIFLTKDSGEGSSSRGDWEDKGGMHGWGRDRSRSPRRFSTRTEDWGSKDSWGSKDYSSKDYGSWDYGSKDYGNKDYYGGGGGKDYYGGGGKSKGKGAYSDPYDLDYVWYMAFSKGMSKGKSKGNGGGKDSGKMVKGKGKSGSSGGKAWGWSKGKGSGRKGGRGDDDSKKGEKSSVDLDKELSSYFGVAAKEKEAPSKAKGDKAEPSASALDSELDKYMERKSEGEKKSDEDAEKKDEPPKGDAEKA